jgi:predicted peroxiredoxin
MRFSYAERSHVKNYLLIESQGTFESTGATNFLALARDLARQGAKVELFLVQNGVMPARVGAKAGDLSAVLRAGIRVWADDFSLRERAVARADVLPGVVPGSISTVVDRMADGWNVIWH